MITILGANGKVGRAAARQLASRGLIYQAAVRNPERFQGPAVNADLRDKSSLLRALQNSTAVLAICPIDLAASDVPAATQALIANLSEALRETRPAHIVAISDYGAQHGGWMGIPSLFHDFEEALRSLGIPCTVLRSAEHGQNWLSFVPSARRGVLPVFYPSATSPRPFVSAGDIGVQAAELLSCAAPSGLRVVQMEGPRRYTADEVAEAMGHFLDLEVRAQTIPRSQWGAVLAKAGQGESFARLLEGTYQAHGEGRVEAEPGREVFYGDTDLLQCWLSSLPVT